MKCKFCGGTGTSNTCVNGTFKPCLPVMARANMNLLTLMLNWTNYIQRSRPTKNGLTGNPPKKKQNGYLNSRTSATGVAENILQEAQVCTTKKNVRLKSA